MIRLFVPGRLCLFGEHSDWAGGHRRHSPELRPGLCLVSSTDQGLSGSAEAASGVFEMTTVRAGGAGEELSASFPLRLDELAKAAAAGGYFSYVAGVVAELLSRREVGGVRLRVTASDLPEAKGLSSSAAACVLVARAFNRVHDMGLGVADEMDVAHAGERRAGSDCGRMDQVCALGPAVNLLSFDGEDFRVEELSVGERLHLLVVDLGGSKDTRAILRDLQACYPDTPGPLAER